MVSDFLCGDDFFLGLSIPWVHELVHTWCENHTSTNAISFASVSFAYGENLSSICTPAERINTRLRGRSSPSRAENTHHTPRRRGSNGLNRMGSHAFNLFVY